MKDLVDDGWIPVRLRDGRQALMGLAEVFDLAGEVERLVPASPLERRALERLLIAIAWRSGSTFESGLNVGAAVSYARAQRAAFAADAFCQYDIAPASSAGNVGLDRLAPASMWWLAPTSMTGAEAVRAMLARMLFDPAGIRVGIAGDPDTVRGKTMPIGPALLAGVHTALVHGPSLAETIRWNLPDGSWTSSMDPPMWEDAKDLPRQPWKGSPSARGRLLVWPSRRLRLYWSEAGTEVTGAMLANGDRVDFAGDALIGLEPHGLWKASAAAKKTVTLRSAPAPVWDMLADRGGPAPVGLARLLDGRITADRVRLNRVGLILGTQAAVVIDVVDDELALAVHGLARRRETLADVEALAFRIVGALGVVRATLTRAPRPSPEWKAAETRRVNDALAPIVEDYLAGRPLNTVGLRALVDDAVQQIAVRLPDERPGEGRLGFGALIGAVRKQMDAIDAQ